MEQLRTDPKHQFEAQVLLSCAAVERRAQQGHSSSNEPDNENGASNGSTANLNQVENLVLMNNTTVPDSMQKYVLYYVQK
jgi:hypothetical protein